MAWVESHQELGGHPKTRKAARRLGIGVPQMVGHLHLMWHWALSYADTGDLSNHDSEDVALGAMWDGDPDDFVKALTDVGFLDSTDRGLVLHDWMDYAGRLIRDRQRKRATRSAGAKDDPPPEAGPSEDVPPPVRGHAPGQSVDRPRARTQPNPTNQPNQPESASRKRSDRAARLPDGWRPAPEPELVAAIGGEPAARRQYAKFCDYWRGKGGQAARKVDWQATWRNWLRSEAERMGPRMVDDRSGSEDRHASAEEWAGRTA